MKRTCAKWMAVFVACISFSTSCTKKLQDADLSIVESLASKNSPPELRRQHSTPIFDENYDWAEYDRILRELKELTSKVNDRTWNEFINHLDDDRYCSTVITQNGATLNLTVGHVCRNVVAATLRAGYDFRIPTRSFEDQLILNRIAGFSAFSEMKTLLSNNTSKSILQLQLTFGENALRNLNDTDLPTSIKQEWASQIKENLKQLERTGQFESANWFAGEQFEVYTKAIADRLRTSIPNE